MKTAIVTNAVYKAEPSYKPLTDELKRRYCDKWGMSYECTDVNYHPGFSGMFSKFTALRKALEKGNDWAVWMDCDAAPVTMDADLQGWLSKHEQKVIMLKDALGWNSGVYAVPNCKRAFEWLKWLDNEANIKRFDKGYRDQDEVAWTFGNNFADFITEDGYDFGFNNYDDLYRHKSKPNLFVEGKSWCLHIPGYGEDYRKHRFDNIIRKLDGRPTHLDVRKDKPTEGKTVSQYIEEGARRILINYPHGLGDLIMFYPHYREFRRLHPKCVIDLKPADAFVPLLPATDAPEDYDVSIYFPAHFTEQTAGLTDMTKPEVNVVYDLGWEYDPELDYADPIVPPLKDHLKSPFVGLNYCCTWYPREANCPEDTARMLWDEVLSAGLVPIELYVPKQRRVENLRYAFVKTSMRDVGPDIMRMMNVMASMRGVASVSTGTFHYGMAAYPETTLFLQNQFKVSSCTRKKVLTLDVNHPDRGTIKEWISRLTQEKGD